MSRIARDVLLVGSVPLATVREVFETCIDSVGPWLGAIPDGEVGDRKFWVTSNVEKVAYRGHPKLEVVEGDHLPPGERSPTEEEALKRLTQVKVRNGVQTIELTGLRFATVATDSYRVFRHLRESGRIPDGTRFQVSLPTTAAAVMQFFRDPNDWPLMFAAYERAILKQVEAILEAVPANDLVIQWDMATEVRDLLAGDRPLYPWAPRSAVVAKWAKHVTDVSRLTRDLPEAVGLGYHFCFGTFGGWPHSTAPDTQVCAELAERIAATAGHRVDYVHIPILPAADANFLAPLAALRSCDTRIFLGIALNDGLESFLRRVSLAERFLPDFGIASYCGWGREKPELLPELLDDLRECALWKFGGA